MAKYVIAGISDCPFYARAELLADELKLRLPDVSVHKIVLKQDEWSDWLSKICHEKEWHYEGGSPIIWRELINRGGKGVLLGSCNEFLEMAKGYYGITCSRMTEELQLIAVENEEIKHTLDYEEEQRVESSNPFQITVTSAESALAYNLVPYLCTGQLLDAEEICLTLYSDLPGGVEQIDVLNGLAMELEDCAQNQLKNVVVESDLRKAFVDADLVIILNCSELRDDNAWLKRLKNYSLSMNTVMKKSSKVLVAGEKALIACYVISQIASDIPRENFFALSRFEENKVKSAMAKQLGIITAGISGAVVWGSSMEFVADHFNTTAKGYNGAIWAPHLEEFSYLVDEMIYDKLWFTDVLPKLLKKENCESSGEKSVLSLSAALISQLQDIMKPNRPGIYSLGLISQGWYDIPEGVVFSFPVTYSSGEIKVKLDLSLSAHLKSSLKENGKKLEVYCKGLVERLK